MAQVAHEREGESSHTRCAFYLDLIVSLFQRLLCPNFDSGLPSQPLICAQCLSWKYIEDRSPRAFGDYLSNSVHTPPSPAGGDKVYNTLPITLVCTLEFTVEFKKQ